MRSPKQRGLKKSRGWKTKLLENAIVIELRRGFVNPTPKELEEIDRLNKLADKGSKD